MSDPVWFDDAAGWRAWLEANHDSAAEVWVGMYKKHSSRHNMTWSEAVDEALCFGWIDSVMHRIDDERHAQRYSPRKSGSIWSAVNVAKIERLRAEGRMHPAGEAAFAKRRADRTGVYAFEQERPAELEPAQRALLDADARAAAFFDAQPPGYRRTAIHWVTSAKRPETRDRRLATLIADSAAGRRLKHLSRP
jgi:uncharacterized protein YdeI (YjbR/CyaY-like superfamily)